MAKKKKSNKNEDSAAMPVTGGSKRKSSATRVSGSPESTGGSREGNIGHEHTAEAGRGDRQV